MIAPRTPVSLRAAVLLAVTFLAAPGLLSQTTLEIRGGIIGDVTRIDLAGPNLKPFALFFSLNEGPTPLALFTFPESRSIEVGLDLFPSLTFFGLLPSTYNIGIPHDLAFLALPTPLYAQHVTFLGPGGALFDEIGNPSAIFFTDHDLSRNAPSPLSAVRAMHTATLLQNQDVLIAGGGPIVSIMPTGVDTALVLDHHRRRWIPTMNNMSSGRSFHSANRLGNGKVLLAGGADAAGNTTASADLFDPATRSFSPTGSISNPRAIHATTMLQDGRVFLCGGTNTFHPTDVVQTLLGTTDRAEIYDPATGMFTRVRNMPRRLIGHTASTLPNGWVLIYGGVRMEEFLGIPVPSFPVETAIYDPSQNIYIQAGDASQGRAWHSATTLADGRILMSGGFRGSFLPTINLNAVQDAEIFDLVGIAWVPTGSLNSPRVKHDGVLLPDGRVVVAGGAQGSPFSPTSSSDVEAWNPGTGTWTLFQSQLITARGFHTSTLLPGNHIALIGGADNQQFSINAAEYFTP